MNERTWQRLLAMLCFALLLSPVARGQTLKKSVIGSGATGAAAGNVVMAGTVGQTIIGRDSNSTLKGSLGFWYTVVMKPGGLDVHEEHTAQTGAELASLQVAPNPVSDVAQIRVVLPRGGDVSLKVYDAVGREHQTLIDGPREAGIITVQLGAGDLASGTYTLVLITNGIHRTTTMQVIK